LTPAAAKAEDSWLPDTPEPNMPQPQLPFIPLNIAVLTVSDTRTPANDTSGDALASALETDGHRLAARELCPDDRYQMRAIVSRWIADPDVHAVLVTGGTGMTGRDSTPEALTPLFDKVVDGFGELFRHISFGEIGTSTVQSRATAGLVNRTLVFCLPGSTGACRTAWNGILHEQLDARHRPCNFVGLNNAVDQPL
jgi:molybdenum cofactor biosynthesis protein B